MGPIFVYPSDVNAWHGGLAVSSNREQALVDAIAAATSWVEREGGRRSLGKSTNTFILDGSRADGACREDLWLPADVRPVWLTDDDEVTVSEDGAALVVAAGYSSSADVIVKGANEDVPACLYRRGGWYPDRQNVVVTLACGWDEELGETLPMPSAIKLLVVEASWLFFNGAGKQGKSSVSKSGTSVTIQDQLSTAAQATLNSLRDF